MSKLTHTLHYAQPYCPPPVDSVSIENLSVAQLLLVTYLVGSLSFSTVEKAGFGISQEEIDALYEGLRAAAKAAGKTINLNLFRVHS